MKKWKYILAGVGAICLVGLLVFFWTSKPKPIQVSEYPDYHALDYVELGDYKNIKVSVPKAQEITEDDLQDKMALYLRNVGFVEKDTNGIVAANDLVELSWTAKVDEKHASSLDSNGHQIVDLSDTAYPKELRDGVLQMKLKESRDISISFGEDASAEYRNKKGVFHVTLHAIVKDKELNDTNVKEASEGVFETVDALKQSIRTSSDKQVESEHKSQIQAEVLKQVSENAKVKETPQSLIDWYVSLQKQQIVSMAKQAGLSEKTLIKQQFDMDESAFWSQVKKDAPKNLKTELILRAIAEQEKITISGQEKEEGRMRFLATQGLLDASKKEQEDAINEQMLENSLLIQKVTTWLTNNAVVSEK